MSRRFALLLVALPLVAAPIVATPALAQRTGPIAAVNTHLRAVRTMTANFTQTDRKGQTLSGVLTLKRPGKIRFQYQKGVPMLIVGDGKSLTMIDYEVKQVQSFPIGGSPLAVLTQDDPSLFRMAEVVREDAKVLVLKATDRGAKEWSATTLVFAKVPSAPGGLLLQGWTALDGQNNLTTIRLSNQRFNQPVADTVFRWTDPRRG